MNVARCSRCWKKRLAERLEQGRAVSRFQAVGDRERRFPNPGTGLAVQSLQRHPETRAIVHKSAEHARVRRGAQHGVAEVSRRDRLHAAVAFFADAVGVFPEHEELILETRLRRQPEPSPAVEHAAQQGTRANRMVAAIGARELADEVRRGVPGQRPLRPGEKPIPGIRKPAMPAGDRTGVVKLVIHVPTEYAVAEAAALGE